MIAQMEIEQTKKYTHQQQQIGIDRQTMAWKRREKERYEMEQEKNSNRNNGI